MKKFFTLASLVSISSLFADEAAAPQSGYMQTLVMIGVAIVFFYLILFRPEQKRRKRSQAMRTSLKKGDKVTAMGIIGSVSKVLDNTIVLKMYDGSEVEFLKAAITDVQPKEEKKS